MSSPRSSTTRGKVPFPIYDDPLLSLSPIAVPAGHFLAPATALESAEQRQAFDDWAAGARPDTSSVAAADYDVSVASGFLPPEEPLRTLMGVGGGWDEIEAVLEEVRAEVVRMESEAVGRVSERWCASVRQLQTPLLAKLTTLPLLRRAHVALSFIAHFYVHSSYPEKWTVPAPIAVPWVAVSDRLGIPPILNYADTVLWNWHLIDPSRGLRADNVAINTTFTSLPSESAFFLLSLLCELQGPAILRLMSATLDEAFFADSLSLTRIVDYLYRIAADIDELRKLLASGTAGKFGIWDAEIVPREFYWQIRPWFNGGKWSYEGVGSRSESVEMEWGGPSAGQSSLVHAIDLFLEVDHAPRVAPVASTSTGTTSQSPVSKLSSTAAAMSPTSPLPPAPTKAYTKTHPPPTDATFMARMSSYMPGPHRAFLTHLASLSSTHSFPSPNAPPSVRALAKTHSAIVGEAYNTAVRSMKTFRDAHFILVTRFIMVPARTEPARESVFWPKWEAERVEKEKKAAEERVEAVALKGTGGTELVTFLKTCRTRTVEAILD